MVPVFNTYCCPSDLAEENNQILLVFKNNVLIRTLVDIKIPNIISNDLCELKPSKFVDRIFRIRFRFLNIESIGFGCGSEVLKGAVLVSVS